MELLGDRLKKIRISKKLSMGKLSEISGISKTSISDIENHKVNATINTLNKIAKALNVNINYLTSPTPNYDKDKHVLLDSGFFTLEDNIRSSFDVLPSLGNLIKYCDKNFDLSILDDASWYSLLDNTSRYLEFELCKINKEILGDEHGNQEK